MAYNKYRSLGGISRALGYPSRPGINGVSRDMWKGLRGIPLFRLKGLCLELNISYKEVEDNIIDKKENVKFEDWSKQYKNYLKNINKK